MKERSAEYVRWYKEDRGERERRLWHCVPTSFAADAKYVITGKPPPLPLPVPYRPPPPQLMLRPPPPTSRSVILGDAGKVWWVGGKVRGKSPDGI